MSFFLIGFRGAGKTTIGNALAQKWGWSFLDLDEEFERENGSILTFIESHGMENFRRKEFEVLETAEDALGLRPNCIVATGGGIVDYQPSRQVLEYSQLAKVYLEVDPEALWDRLSQPERQQILQLTSFDAMDRLLTQRVPFYEKIATFRIKNRDIRLALADLESLGKLLKK